MPKLLLPILTVLAVGGATAGGAAYLLTRDESVEEAPPPAVQATATPDPAATEPPKATPTAEPTPDPTADWKTYTDAAYGYSFDYPTGFVVESTLVSGELPKGVLQDIRVVDERFTEGYPPGQIAISVLTKDSSDLDQWVAEHSDPSDDTRPAYYDVTNFTEGEISGERALSFDSLSLGETNITVHHSVFVWQAHVVDLRWYVHDSTYAPAITTVFEQLRESFRG